MSNAPSTTDLRPHSPHLSTPTIGHDVAAFWYTLGHRGVVGAVGLVRRAHAARRLPDGLRPTLREEGRAQWDELRVLVAAARDGEARRAGWDRVVEHGFAVVDTLRATLLAVLSRRPVLTRTDPPVLEAAAAPDLPVMPPQWSVVIPQRSALASHRHQHLAPETQPSAGPQGRWPRPGLYAAVAALVALVGVVGVVVIATAVPAAPAPVAAPVAAPVPTPTPVPAAPRQPTPDITVTAPTNAAHAVLHPDVARIDLFDDRRDGRTAVLQYKVDGAPRPPLVSTGLTDSTHPADKVGITGLTPRSTVEFRVCVAAAPPTVRDQDCSEWTTRPAS